MKVLNGQVCGLRGIDSWTTKTQMSAVKLYTAFIYTTFIKRFIHNQTCSNAL